MTIELIKLFVKLGKLSLFNSNKTALNNEDEVPIRKPALSNPLIHLPLANPLFILLPRYLIFMKFCKLGSQDPISYSVNSNTVELKLIMLVPGSRPTADNIGNGSSEF